MKVISGLLLYEEFYIHYTKLSFTFVFLVWLVGPGASSRLTPLPEGLGVNKSTIDEAKDKNGQELPSWYMNQPLGKNTESMFTYICTQANNSQIYT
jgi:hypothetical protein